MQVISKQDPEAEEKNSLSQDAITLRDLNCQVVEVFSKQKNCLIFESKTETEIAKSNKNNSLKHPE